MVSFCIIRSGSGFSLLPACGIGPWLRASGGPVVALDFPNSLEKIVYTALPASNHCCVGWLVIEASIGTAA
jgi:hypothetical protein